ncbi:MAG: autotransporter outer membrane beta-barrel domain-containing protein [Porticoccaceae bacterium]
MGSFNTKQDMKKLTTGRAVELFERSALSTAVRGVLFASSATTAMLLPGMASGAPLPANCVQTNLETVTCIGAVTDNVIPDPINDLTVIIGDALDPDATTLDLTTYSVSGPGVVAQSYNAIGDATVINNSAITTYDGWGIMVDAGADATIENNGSVYATKYDDVVGLFAASENGNAVVTNNGSVEAYGEWATGVVAYSANNDALVYNNGDITVDGGGAGTGIWAGSEYEDATVVVAEGASVTVDAWKYATGVAVGAGTDSPNDYAVASIAGTVDVTTKYEATGVWAGGSDVDIDVTATGSVTATAGNAYAAWAEATGIYTEMGAQDYAVVDIAVDGSVSATATARYSATATGVGVNGTYFDGYSYFAADSIAVSNTSVNSITATATTTWYGDAQAEGIAIEGGIDTLIDVYNSGLVTATATNYDWYSSASATGIAVDAVSGMSITNAYGGTVEANATTSVWGNAEATGISAWSKYGTTSIVNDGAVTADADGLNDGTATATGIDAASWDADISISGYGGGTVSANADATYATNASGIDAWTRYGSIEISGQAADATAYSSLGTANATGIDAYSELGWVSVKYSSSGDATATAYYGANATGIDAGSRYNDVVVADSSASATAESTWIGDANATGIEAYAYDGGVGVWGDYITVTADATAAYGDANATGIDAYAENWGYVGVGYGSSVEATATAYFEADATGVALSVYSGNATVGIEGSVAATATATSAYGTADAIGVIAGSGWGSTYVEGYNGTVDATATSNGYASSANAVGVVAWGYNEAFVGGLTVTADATANGAYSSAWAAGVDVGADGEVGVWDVDATATATGDYAYAGGIVVSSNEWGTAYVSNSSGSAEAIASGTYGSAWAGGISAVAPGPVWIDYADGDATASGADAGATGIQAISWQSNVYVEGSSGSATAIGNAVWSGYADATGIEANGEDGVWMVDSYGDADATATSVYSGAIANATGIYAYSEWAESGTTIKYSAGEATATATGGTYSGYTTSADATGIDASSKYSVTMVAVSGDAEATSTASGEYTWSNADAAGISAYGEWGDVSIDGASATADASATNTGAYGEADAWAVGVDAYSGWGDVSVAIGAYDVVSATATVNSAYGEAWAVGVNAESDEGGAVAFSNAGSISADASVSGYGWGVAIGADISGYTVNASNAGDITAMASGDGAWAVGLDVSGYNSNTYDVYGAYTGTGPLTVSNSGGIYATAAADGVKYGAGATGINVESWGGDVVVTNAESGVIVVDAAATGAYSEAFSAAVSVSNSDGDYTTIVNDGTITATASGDYANAYAVHVEGGSDVTILNYGTMTGAIYTGWGDDFVGNYSGNTWNATGDSYLGDGDDVVYNATTGRIVMTDASIDLGSSGYAGNQFNNQGLLEVFGDNTIRMGDTYVSYAYVEAGAEYSANKYAFNNTDGTISMINGQVGDSLTLIGDFYSAGSSTLNVDVDGAAGIADTLYINGDVIANGPTTVNGNLLTMPTDIDTVITVVEVAEGGAHVEGDFIAGELTVNPDSFLTFDLEGLYVPPSSPSQFVFALSTTGLSDPGVLASSLSPAVQSLWQSGVGTLHQRQGAVRDQSLGKLSVWLRTFTTDGTIDPDGAQANLEFDQENKGYEVGVDIALNDQWRVGILAGESEAEVDLNDATGSADIDGDTLGVYLTWLAANNWYADLSYRMMDFDGDAKGSGAAVMDVDGDADGWNLEVGKTITLASGLVVEPQFQYTSMEVDLDDIVNTSGTFAQKDGDSSRVRAGVMLRKAYQSGTSKWTPYGSLNVVEELDGENSFNAGAYSSDSDIGGTSVLVEGGVNAQFGDVIVFGGVNYQDGDALDGIVGGQLGVRFSW